MMQISCQNSNRIQIDAISQFTRQVKPYRFENAPLLAAFPNRRVFDRCLVNRRRNCIENNAVTNEAAFVETVPQFRARKEVRKANIGSQKSFFWSKTSEKVTAKVRD